MRCWESCVFFGSLWKHRDQHSTGSGSAPEPVVPVSLLSSDHIMIARDREWQSTLTQRNILTYWHTYRMPSPPLIVVPGVQPMPFRAA